ncbi:ABC transporter substrate binding protein [Aquabacterium sp.]|uniref:ABC transporter substrate binding protein n=1 Tax=Aquabacterium sp. TaxID=1872578 RepID=UPI002BAD2578|nr:ABC transporter substrate binding protein [Aquabacterium sp.]HSW07690.1 ABC transporter substrate binding protein [Aquabacterium sp.]
MVLLPVARHAVAAEPAAAIGVLYPDIGEPYRSIFTKIIEGIEQQAKGRVASFAVGTATIGPELATELRRRDLRVVIALGRNGLKAAAALERALPVVAGGVLAVPEAEARDFAVHSLTPDPALLFARLRTLVPGARRVAVVFDPRQNAWLMRLAREAARAQGLELLATEAEDLKSALRAYQGTMATLESRRDALWLPHDSTTVDDSSVLPLVLQEAWDRSFTVISSSVAHVRRGALFSLYPDNLALGRRLGGAALAALGGARPSGVLPLKDVLIAANVRAANHLGLNFAAGQHSFDMVFPES